MELIGSISQCAAALASFFENREYILPSPGSIVPSRKRPLVMSEASLRETFATDDEAVAVAYTSTSTPQNSIKMDKQREIESGDMIGRTG